MSLSRYLTRLIWLCLLPLALLAAGLAVLHVQRVQEASRVAAERMVNRVAAAINGDLDARINALRLLAASQHGGDSPDQQALYRQAQSFQQNFGSHIIFARIDGQILFNTRQPLGTAWPMLPQTRDYGANMTALNAGQAVVGNLFQGRFTTDRQVWAAVPVQREGKTLFMLIALVPSQQFQDQLDRAALAPGHALTLLDGHGAVMARRGPQDIDPSGEAGAVSRFVVPSSASPWSVTLDIPPTLYFRPMIEAGGVLLAALLAASLAGMLGGRLGSRRLASSVTSLSQEPAPGAPPPRIAEFADARRRLDQSLAQGRAAEAARLESEQQFRRIFEQAAMGISLTDLQGRMMRVNPHLCDITGYRSDELQTMRFQDITHPDDLDLDLSATRQVLTGERADFAMEKRYLRKDGSLVWVHMTVTLIRHPDASPSHFIAVIEDIERRKLAEAALLASEASLKEAQRVARLGSWAVDLRSGRRSWSGECYRIFGSDPGHPPPRHRDFKHFFTPESWERLSDSVLACRTQGTPMRCDLEIVLVDGLHRWLTARGEVVLGTDGVATRLHGTLQDITEERRAADELHQHRHHLEQLVQSRTGELTAALQDSTQARHHLQAEIHERQRTEARLRAALETARAGIFEWDTATGVDFWSSGLWSLYGVQDPAAPAGYATWKATVHPDDLEQARRILYYARTKGAAFTIEWRVRPMPGEAPRWLVARGTPVVGPDGRVTGYRGISADITERKHVELELEQYRTRLEERVTQRSAELALAEADQHRLSRALRLLSDGNAATVRATSERQLLDELCRLAVDSGRHLSGWVGVAVHDAGKSIRPLAQSGYEAGVLENANLSWDDSQAIGQGPTGMALRTGKTQIINHCLSNPVMAPWHQTLARRGTQAIAALPLKVNQRILAVFSLVSTDPDAFDANEVRLLEELAGNMAFGLQTLRERAELDAYRLQLEDRVNERTREIAALNTELLAKAREADLASQAKSAFLAAMSHEIRTPLNAVVGLTGLLGSTRLDRRQRDFAEKIELSAQALRALVDDVLDFSRIEAGALHLELAPFSLNAILRTTAAVISAGLRDKRVEALFDVAADVPDALHGDALRLQQILLNLTGNAVKFTEAGEIAVSVRCGGRDADRATLQIAVRDTGIGIAADQFKRIFDSFTQTDTSISRRYGGTGLGLAISNRLAGLMGGELAVDSTPGRGSTFTLTVTLALDHQKAAAAPDDSLAGLRLLVVDDHPLAREVLKRNCEALGWEAATCESGAAGLAELLRSAEEGQDYDLMLLDWHMPGMDGLEMLRQANQTPGMGLPQVILLASLVEMQQAIAASDDLYIDGIASKPITPMVLLDAVRRARSGAFSGFLPEPEKADQRLAGMRLLVAEDNELNQEVIGQILARAGAQVVMASNGREAVDAVLLPGAHFDAVLMDIQMPVMDGYSAARVIREELGRVDLPIIAVTAFASPADHERSRLAGLAGHIVKPLDIEDLLDIVTRKAGAQPPEPGEKPAAPTGAPAHPIRIEGLNVAVALKAFGGDGRRYGEMLRQFHLRHGGDPDEAARLFSAGDGPGAAKLVHGLRGVAAILQATAMAGLAGDAEGALLDGPPQAVGPALRALQAGMSDFPGTVAQFEAQWVLALHRSAPQ